MLPLCTDKRKGLMFLLDFFFVVERLAPRELQLIRIDEICTDILAFFLEFCLEDLLVNEMR